MPGFATRVLPTPIGVLHAEATDLGVTNLTGGAEQAPADTVADAGAAAGADTAAAAAAHLELLAREVDDYFSGVLRCFSVSLDLEGAGVRDEFALAVYEEIRAIGYGEIESYGQISVDAGRPRNARRVGSLCRDVPVVLVIPVHRVVRADGGFGDHGETRRRLVAHERAHAGTG